MKCENCGIPEGTLKDAGYTAEIVRKGENAYRGTKKATVWCCSETCGIQALALSQYGNMTSKWPITLAQCTSIFRRKLTPCQKPS